MRRGIVYLDIETTGLMTENNEIIRITAVRDGDRFHTWVKPQKSIAYESKMILGLDGLEQKLFTEAPELGDALVSFSAFISTMPVATRNVEFAFRFFRTAYERVLGRQFANEIMELNESDGGAEMALRFCIFNDCREKGLSYSQARRLAGESVNVDDYDAESDALHPFCVGCESDCYNCCKFCEE